MQQYEQQIPERLQVSIAEAGRLLSFDSRTIRRMLTRGDLDFTGHGRGRRITMASIRAYIETNSQNYGTTTH